MRTDAVFKRAYNKALELIGDRAIGAGLDSEHVLARELDVSRTTVRKIIEALVAARLVSEGDAQTRVVIRHPAPGEIFPEEETELASETVMRGFMELVQSEEISPGQQISTVDLARRLGVSASAVREYLNGFANFGLIARDPKGAWIFRGFDVDFARELCDVRELFELRAVDVFCDLPLDHEAWQTLERLERRHQALLADFDSRGHEFPNLDREFHTLLNSVLNNRFVSNFNDIRIFIFHYHYQWNRSDETNRNRIALEEHLDYMAALAARERAAARAAAIRHLRSARISLLRATTARTAAGG